MPLRLLIRADASPSIGTGHVMRCLALAHAIKASGGSVCFVASEMPDFLREKIIHDGYAYQSLKKSAYGPDDAQETLAYAKAYEALWIALDGYAFDDMYRKALQGKGIPLLALHDFPAEYGVADVILNQNIGAERSAGAQPLSAQLLAGPRFALLREEFSKHKAKKASGSNADNILVTLGGADPSNVTRKIIEALAEMHLRHVTVVIGGAHPEKAVLEKAAKSAGFTCVSNATNMPQLMEEADIALAAGGTTTYELACMGVPMILLVLAENQRDVAQQWERSGGAVNLGWHADITPEAIRQAVQSLRADPDKRSIMSKQCQSFVDGYGALRVCQKLSEDPLWLRDAMTDDCMQIFGWANDPEARSASFSSASIIEDDHRKWFTKKLTSPNDRLSIAMDTDDLPVGLVRFALEGNRATISINLDKACRGKGYGTALIKQGCNRLFRTSDAKEVDAFIKPDNLASIKAFQKAGFQERGLSEIHGQSALHMTIARATMPV